MPIIVMKKSMQFFAYTIVCTEHNWISIFGFDEEIDRIHLPSRVTAVSITMFLADCGLNFER